MLKIENINKHMDNQNSNQAESNRHTLCHMYESFHARKIRRQLGFASF